MSIRHRSVHCPLPCRSLHFHMSIRQRSAHFPLPCRSLNFQLDYSCVSGIDTFSLLLFISRKVDYLWDSVVTLGSRCLTPRPTGIYSKSAPYTLRNTWPCPVWHGPKLSRLTWKYFFSGVEIFLLCCGNVSSLVWTFFIFIPILQ